MRTIRLVFLIKITSTVFLSFCSQRTHSQVKDIGIKGGVSFSQFNVERARGEKIRNGYIIGSYGQWEFPSKVGIETGIYYEAKGSILRIRMSNSSDLTNVPLNLNYFTIPLLVNYRFLKHFRINGGVYAGNLLSVNLIIERDDQDQVSFADIEKDNFRDIDFGFITGLSFHIDPLSISYRYTNSWSDQVSSDSNAIFSRFFEGAKNSASQITLGFNFLTKKSKTL